MTKTPLNREHILELVGNYGKSLSIAAPFEPGVTPVPVSGKVLSGEELVMMTDAVLDGWLTTGRFNESFERELASYIGNSSESL